MALALRVIGPASVGSVSSFEFYPGEDATLRLQVINLDSGCGFSIPSGATKTLDLAGTPSDITITDGDITVDSSDDSIFSVDLTDTQTMAMITGDITFTYVDGTTTRIAVLELGLKKLTISV